ncbi:transcriptional regulator [Streptomyces phaeoluteigriseus]|uniref:Transcriptional regulator n=1 Tax=Streptomyces phaeoluteigriseus TaxID=114686 RepID=A0A1V6MLA0_9ACTN|nr:helix-turn-helix transcriptional regulator [Streptomyces phaeoluteigriseus]OQD53063.1 transcriptional regulator [Streptomyces phaeoluteigriseus]
MAANSNPTVRRRRLGAELRRLRQASGLKSTEVAERLMVSQPKISHLENGRRAISPRDVRDLCAIYGVTDQQVIDALMQMAEESGQQGWWNVYGDVPQSVYIALETDAATVRAYEPLTIPGLLQTPAYAQAVIRAAMPALTAARAAGRLKVRLRRQHRIYDPTRPLRLWVVLDESVLRRVVGSPDIMREQLEHLNAISAEPHITVQILPYAAGAHPALSGQFSILSFADTPEAVVHVERFSSDLYLEKASDVRHFGAMYEHLQTQALSPDDSRDFVTDTVKSYIDAASRPACPAPRSWTLSETLHFE